MKYLTVDLNGDVGESPSVASETDAQLMLYITSANIACGGHSGDPDTMRETLKLAKANQVSAGAHPGFPDRENFGRLAISLPIPSLERSLVEQISGLQAIGEEVGAPVAHVKPHGALYHAANSDADIAKAIGRAAVTCDPLLILVGQAGSRCLEVWRGMDLAVAAEAFADRAYESDGTLRKRTLPGALLPTVADATRQALSIVLDHRLRAFDGSEIKITAQTICLHSDTPGAAEVARHIRHQLQQAGCDVRPFHRQMS